MTSEAGHFWEAEAEDQDYLQRHPDGETCHLPRPDCGTGLSTLVAPVVIGE